MRRRKEPSVLDAYAMFMEKGFQVGLFCGIGIVLAVVAVEKSLLLGVGVFIIILLLSYWYVWASYRKDEKIGLCSEIHKMFLEHWHRGNK